MAKSKSKALISMADLEKMYATEAVAAAVAAPVGDGAPRISTKDQQFVVGETELPDPLEVIVVAEALLNVWYDQDYDPDSPSPPACFAVGPVLEVDKDGKPVPGTGEAALRAHPTSPNIQGGANGHDCLTCELNKFGSAERGAGKACGNTRQLAVVMAADPALRGEGALQHAVLSLSPTALKGWGKFVKGLSEVVHRPPHGVVTRFSFNKKDPDERKRKAVVAIGYQPITDAGIALKVKELRAQLLKDGSLTRPLPVEARVSEKPSRAAKKGKANGGARAKKAEPARAARF